VLKAHEVKSTCTKQFLTLIDFLFYATTQSLTVQEGEISRENAWYMKIEGDGIRPVKPVCMVSSDNGRFTFNVLLCLKMSLQHN